MLSSFLGVLPILTPPLCALALSCYTILIWHHVYCICITPACRLLETPGRQVSNVAVAFLAGMLYA
jgi:hypothetical protein